MLMLTSEFSLAVNIYIAVKKIYDAFPGTLYDIQRMAMHPWLRVW